MSKEFFAHIFERPKSLIITQFKKNDDSLSTNISELTQICFNFYQELYDLKEELKCPTKY
jgi:hypothetical protein